MLLQYRCEGFPADLNSSCTDICVAYQPHMPALYPCVYHEISQAVDMLFHNLCPSWSLCDNLNRLVLFHLSPSSIIRLMAVFPAVDLMHLTVHMIFVFLKSALYPLADDLYLFLLNEVYITFLFITHTIVLRGPDRGNVRPHCERVLTCGGGGPHEFFSFRY